MLKIQLYTLESGVRPFGRWFLDLNKASKAKINAYIDRVALGGSRKNIRAITEGLCELKIDCGPGYRVYFGIVDCKIMILLAGGDKNTQLRDIEKAKEYWRQANA